MIKFDYPCKTCEKAGKLHERCNEYEKAKEEHAVKRELARSNYLRVTGSEAINPRKHGVVTKFRVGGD